MHAVLQDVHRRLARELQGIDALQAQLHPAGNARRWSMQQVVEHLALTYQLTAQNLQLRLDKDRVSRKLARSYTQWLLQLMILSAGHLPKGYPAPDDTVPAPGQFHVMDGAEMAELLATELEEMDDVLRRCSERFGMERVAPHPILGPLRVDQWRRFHVVHGLHHAAQLTEIRREVLGPGGERRRSSGQVLGKEMQVPAHRSLT